LQTAALRSYPPLEGRQAVTGVGNDRRPIRPLVSGLGIVRKSLGRHIAAVQSTEIDKLRSGSRGKGERPRSPRSRTGCVEGVVSGSRVGALGEVGTLCAGRAHGRGTVRGNSPAKTKTSARCTETVDWFVLAEPAQVAEGDVKSFTRLYPNNKSAGVSVTCRDRVRFLTIDYTREIGFGAPRRRMSPAEEGSAQRVVD
jgi:hypothetical protein